MGARIIRFLAETGMRQEEVCGLEWMRYAHRVTAHLHRAMADFGANTGTKAGTIGTVLPLPAATALT